MLNARTATVAALVTALLVIAPGVSGAATHKLPVVDATCGAVGAIRPKEIVLACGDGNAVALKLHWSSWKATRAFGTGQLSQNTCTPDCADGTFKSYAATFTLTDVVPTHGLAYFTSVTITFPHASPIKRRSETVSDCFVTPPKPGDPICPADSQNGG
jgi:hypothetical protein